MDGSVGGSFRVHLQSLNEFARRLREQLEVAQRSTRSAALFNRPPDLPLGAFAEAFALSDDHSDAARQSEDLLAKVTRSIDFARSVTELVAQRYEALNRAGAQSIAAVGGSLPPMPNPLMPTVRPRPAYAQPAAPAQPVTGTAAPPAGSLAPPEILARFTFPAPPDSGTVYYYNGSTTIPVSVTVQAQDA